MTAGRPDPRRLSDRLWGAGGRAAPRGGSRLRRQRRRRYLCFVAVLVWLMRARRPLQLFGPMLAYNAVQVALCSYMTVGLVRVVAYEAPWFEVTPGVVVPNLMCLRVPACEAVRAPPLRARRRC